MLGSWKERCAGSFIVFAKKRGAAHNSRWAGSYLSTKFLFFGLTRAGGRYVVFSTFSTIFGA